MEKRSDRFKVSAADSVAGRFYVSLIDKKSNVFFLVISLREDDSFHCMLADLVLCAMSTGSGIVL